MIWLAWRRHRFVLLLFATLLIALGTWMVVMVLLHHPYSDAQSIQPCLNAPNLCGVYRGILSAQNQDTGIAYLLLFVPCLLGVVFGAPLVAAELENHTNRLAWTQGISRSKWIITKWLLAGLTVALFVSVLTSVTQWWIGNADRLEPRFFPITGVVPIAYTLFAFALGAALGAIVRRTTWAIVGTVIIYTGLALLMVYVVRPSLDSQTFTPVASSASGFSVSSESISNSSWSLGIGFRFKPGANIPAGTPAANEIAQRCQNQHYNYSPYIHCLATHDVQEGSFFQPGNHYWPLQWREAAIYLGAALLLLGTTIGAVRRWRA